MTHKSIIRNLTGIIITALTIFFITGCYKTTTVPVDNTEEITEPVSFTSDIIPIFNNSCNLSGCHNTGGTEPDLSASNAYNALQSGGYINTANPESSELYLWMTGQRDTPMPVSGSNPEYNALVLAWIKQGAENN